MLFPHIATWAAHSPGAGLDSHRFPEVLLLNCKFVEFGSRESFTARYSEENARVLLKNPNSLKAFSTVRAGRPRVLISSCTILIG